jgi:D-amino-acid dehydrogenase
MAEEGSGESARKTVAIIGAGIVGVSTAVWLQREGHDVILIDRAGPGEGTSYGNGGVLASVAVVPVTVPGLMKKAPGMLLNQDSPLFLRWSYLPKLLPWLVRYLRHCRPDEVRRIAAAVEQIIGDSLEQHQAVAKGTKAEKWLVPSDYVFVYNDRARYEGDAFGWQVRRELGFSWDELEGEAFRAYEPAFSEKLQFATRLKDHGHITDPGRYVKDLAEHVVSQGGRLVTANVDDFASENGRLCGVVCGGETIPCDEAVLTAGVWSKGLMEKLGIDVPMETERGYHVELYEPNITPRAPCMVAAGKFVMTPMEGRLRLAGIVEFGGLDAPPSKAPFELLIRQARAALPGLEWKERRDWMGHRPAPADSIPVIGEVPGMNGLYCGFGHHHIGLTGGPKTGRLLAQMIAGKAPNIDMATYAPSRFGRSKH